MNINIAFNTIIYIMVFLFPGVLFRRFYFVGKHKNQFNHGSLFERFMMTIILSIACLIGYTIFTEFILRDRFDIHLINHLEYSEFVALFTALIDNKVPSFFQEKEKFKQFSLLFFCIYAFSAGIGYSFFKIIDFTKIDRYFSFLRFINEWDYLFHAPSRELRKKIPNKILAINVDVLTKSKNEEILFQGVLYKVLYNKDNELESIAIRNVQKFIEISKDTDEGKNKIRDIRESIKNKELRYSNYRNYRNSQIFKRAINSDIFIINKSEIVNYNVLYVSEGKKEKNATPWFSSPYINRIKGLLTAPFCVLPFISFEISYLDSFWKKTIFSIYSILYIYWIFTVITRVAKSKREHKLSVKGVINVLLITLLFSFFYLWFFKLVSIQVIVSLLGLILGILATSFSAKK